VYLVYRGTHRGELFGVPPSGKTIAVESMTIDQFRGERVVEEWEIPDNMGLMQQIGAVPMQG